MISKVTQLCIRVSSAGSTDGRFFYRMTDHAMSRRNVGLQVPRCEGEQRVSPTPCSRSQPNKTSTNSRLRSTLLVAAHPIGQTHSPLTNPNPNLSYRR